MTKKTDPRKLDFGSLPELPREKGLILEDLNINGRKEYVALCKRMRTDKEAQKRLSLVREVLFELMARDTEERLKRDDFGEIPTIEETNALGQKVKTPVYEYELRSRWDVEEGADTHVGGGGPGRVKPKTGHWKTFVAENWEHLAPLLVFRDENVSAPRNDRMANPEMYREAVKWSMSDDHPDRRALKEWLPGFLEAGVGSSWDGKRQTAITGEVVHG